MIEWLSRLITYIQTGSVGISHDIPSLVDRTVGTLLLPSRILSLGDIQSPRALELPAFAADQATVSVKTLEYPSGAVKVVKLTLVASSLVTVESRREVGGLGIDSAKMIVADKGDMDLHWTDVGKDRIGIISAASAGAAFKVLKRPMRTSRSPSPIPAVTPAGPRRPTPSIG